jgi:hypothetical protein
VKQEAAAVSTPQAGVDVGGTCVTVSDVIEAIAWLEANMGTRFTFTQGMKGLSNPLAAWSANRGYIGLKKNPHSSTIPAKGKILDYLRLSLTSAAAIQAAQTAALAASKAGAGQGFSVDPAEKTAVEMRAMEAARSHYAGLGWTEDPADAEAYKHESFDLVLHRDGEVKDVEVKGTTQTTGLPDSGIQVFLTPNEVAHARGQCKAVVTCHSVALFILTDVKITPDTDGAPAAVGGTPRVYDPWNLADGTLEPTAYSYNVPGQ